jgi:hypothetical protein
MIKRVRFATRRADVGPEIFAATWREAAAAVVAGCPDDARPLRAALCTSVAGVGGVQCHDGVALTWFGDADQLARFERWWDAGAGGPAEQLHQIWDDAASPVIVFDEAIMRGEDWLEERWRQGGPKLKHMAIARRAAHLSPAEFSAVWRNRAGMVRRPGAAEATPIPEEARGKAYVQNHPVARAVGEWPYDAFNEVYFDDIESLRRRAEWFAESLGSGTEDDFVSQNWFLVASEEVLIGGP